VLGFFVVATEFFCEQSIPITIYQFTICTVLTAALMGRTQSSSHRVPVRTGKVAATLVLQSVPLMIILFIFFPRIDPLWSLDLSSDRASTGISDSMTPGDIAELSQSGELAFRVNFISGDIPQKENLYWRGVVMSYYDGRTWSEATRPITASDSVNWAGKSADKWDKLVVRRGNVVEYDVILEPTEQRWLFGLDTPMSETKSVGFTRDFRLIRNIPVSQLFMYRVTSHLDYNIGFFLEPWLRQQNLQLPSSGDSKARELAESLFLRANGDHEAYIQLVLDWLRDRPFVYTLKPPKLGRNSVDEFLFDTQKGFCAHYSSAFAFLMRAAGVPARVVAGYQGGELNPMGNYLLVHQFDAHAWNEVWIKNQGWVRVDPTALVSPERIEDGIGEALRQRNELASQSTFSSLRFQDVKLLNDIRYALDYVNFSWNKFVLGYDAKLQTDFLQDFLGNVTPQRLAFVMMGLVLLIVTIIGVALISNNRKKSKDKVNRIYLGLIETLNQLGLSKEADETPMQFTQRLQVAEHSILDEKTLKALTELSDEYEKIQYQPRATAREKDVEIFKQKVTALRRTLMGSVLLSKVRKPSHSSSKLSV